MMHYIKEISTHQIEINKSLFIGILFPLNSIEEIKEKLEEAKTMFPKATHYCSASLFGKGHEHATSNDDGEPSRTAGLPILETLKLHHITNVLCVVVRYYGGKKLGASGLIRAYRRAASEVLQKATFFDKKLMQGHSITFPYPFIHKVDHLLENIAVIEDKVFLDDVTYKVYFKEKDMSVFDDMKHQFIHQEPLEDKILWIKVEK